MATTTTTTTTMNVAPLVSKQNTTAGVGFIILGMMFVGMMCLYAWGEGDGSLADYEHDNPRSARSLFCLSNVLTCGVLGLCRACFKKDTVGVVMNGADVARNHQVVNAVHDML